MNANSDNFSPVEYEGRWIKHWQEKNIYKSNTNDDKEKSYVLIEFPYPSGEGLHVGHARSYSCLDSVARLRRMKGFNVMFPFGWDAFGLPAENYAIKTGIQPMITTKKVISRAKEQVLSWGLSFDWEREVNTTDSDYYKWTQWIFVQMFKKGLAYKEELAVNWCPSCRINLANEEVVDGKCERCGSKTERRNQSQWLLGITKYADRLLEDLKSVNFRHDIAIQQINWIGKKTGAKVKFSNLEVFTTRLDTIFGVTFLAASPEAMKDLLDKVPEKNRDNVTNYVKEALNKSERDRKQKSEKTGVDTGIWVTNPANSEKVPLWVAEYVLNDVGTGVVMGVPAHDERDFEFAQKYNLEIRKVFDEIDNKLINSGKYDGMGMEEATENMVKNGIGERDVHFHLRDWVFSRQHYWGEPIPMINCPKDGWVPVPEGELPVTLPEVEKYQPTGTGESPLAHVDSFINTTCPKCGGLAKRETDTMPNWAGSSWYYLRYCDPHNSTRLADKQALEYWLPVDWYNGGMEHTTLHLLYSRFWHKFLYDLGVVPTIEPYAKRTSHGVVLGVDGRKMSKSKGNVISPDEVVTKFGADTLRLYEMFIGPFDQMVSWSWEGVEGVHRFLKRIWRLALTCADGEETVADTKKKLAKLTKKIEDDLESMKFNTAVASMMEFVNWWGENPNMMTKEAGGKFLRILAVMAPFMAEELYQRLGLLTASLDSIHQTSWPEYSENDLINETVTLIVQVNGKIRAKMIETKSRSKEDLEKSALENENVRRFVAGDYKVIYVPGKVINFITE